MSMAQAIRRVIHDIEPSRSMYDISTLEEQIGASQTETKLRTFLLTAFAATALSLACMGLYATSSYLGRLRRRETGVRIAIGASRWNIAGSFLREAALTAAVGCAAGLAFGAMLSRMITGMLYGISPSDPVTYVRVLLLVGCVCLVSAATPAIRSALTDPVRALREQ
jgi:ABC-type antimicrobial peptide transport system permease subunit